MLGLNPVTHPPVDKLNSALSLDGSDSRIGTWMVHHLHGTVSHVISWRGSHLVIIPAGSKTELMISATDSCSWYAFSAEVIGAHDVSIKWIIIPSWSRTRLRAPSKRRDEFRNKMTWSMSLFKFVYVGLLISRLCLQTSYKASLWRQKVQSVCHREHRFVGLYNSRYLRRWKKSKGKIGLSSMGDG